MLIARFGCACRASGSPETPSKARSCLWNQGRLRPAAKRIINNNDKAKTKPSPSQKPNNSQNQAQPRNQNHHHPMSTRPPTGSLCQERYGALLPGLPRGPSNRYAFDVKTIMTIIRPVPSDFWSWFSIDFLFCSNSWLLIFCWLNWLYVCMYVCM